jgi:hypothetical protein
LKIPTQFQEHPNQDLLCHPEQTYLEASAQHQQHLAQISGRMRAQQAIKISIAEVVLTETLVFLE